MPKGAKILCFLNWEQMIRPLGILKLSSFLLIQSQQQNNLKLPSLLPRKKELENIKKTFPFRGCYAGF